MLLIMERKVETLADKNGMKRSDSKTLSATDHGKEGGRGRKVNHLMLW